VKLYEGKIVPVLNEFGVGGGYTECGWYCRGSLWHFVQALELARRVEGYDGFQKAPRFYYQRLAYEMFQPYPGLWMYGAERFPVEGDGANTYGGHNEYPRHLRTVLAQYFRGSELAQAVANKKRRGSNPEAVTVSFLYEEPADAPRDLKDFPLAHLASGIGRVYARSDWTDDATWFRFECGDYWNGHQHFEAGNFEVFRYEPLATESGEYHDYLSSHSVNWLVRTIAHNCILVYQPDEQWTRMRDGGRSKYANDGGQAKKWEWPVDTLDIWKSRRAVRARQHRGLSEPSRVSVCGRRLHQGVCANENGVMGSPNCVHSTTHLCDSRSRREYTRALREDLAAAFPQRTCDSRPDGDNQ